MKPSSIFNFSAKLTKRFVLIMAAAYLVMMILYLLRFESMKTFSERKIKRSLPTLSRNVTIGSFIGQLETFLLDHFPLRNPLIVGKRTLDFYLLGKISGDRAILGKNGWWYNLNTIRTSLEPLPKEPSYLAVLESTLKHRATRLQEQGITLLFLPTPRKLDIYPDHLPEEYQGKFSKSLYETYVEHLSARLPQQVLNSFPTLRIARSRVDIIYPPFYKTDTHWSPEGARLVAEEILARLQKQRPEPIAQVVQVDHYGDLPRLAGIYQPEPVRKRVSPTPLSYFDLDPQLASLVHAQDRAVQVHGFGSGRLLITGTSFVPDLLPTLAWGWEEILVLDHTQLGGGCDRQGRDWPKLLKHFKPNAIIVQVPGNYLSTGKAECHQFIPEEYIPTL